MRNNSYSWICPNCGIENSLFFCTCEKCGKLELNPQKSNDKLLEKNRGK
jgi:hypothetical protein